MGYEPIGYYEPAGGTMLAEGGVSWSNNGASSVTVSVSLDYCYAQGWRIKNRAILAIQELLQEVLLANFQHLSPQQIGKHMCFR